MQGPGEILHANKETKQRRGMERSAEGPRRAPSSLFSDTSYQAKVTNPANPTQAAIPEIPLPVITLSPSAVFEMTPRRGPRRGPPELQRR